jgi:hypothetical protein
MSPEETSIVSLFIERWDDDMLPVSHSTTMGRVEITGSLIESVLRRPFDFPPFGFEKRYEFVSNRQDAISFAALFSALRMNGERPAADRPFATLHRVVNLLPCFLPVSRNRICPAILERNDIDNLHGSSL